jgi:hypothetical protein
VVSDSEVSRVEPSVSRRTKRRTLTERSAPVSTERNGQAVSGRPVWGRRSRFMPQAAIPAVESRRPNAAGAGCQNRQPAHAETHTSSYFVNLRLSSL